MQVTLRQESEEQAQNFLASSGSRAGLDGKAGARVTQGGQAATLQGSGAERVEGGG